TRQHQASPPPAPAAGASHSTATTAPAPHKPLNSRPSQPKQLDRRICKPSSTSSRSHGRGVSSSSWDGSVGLHCAHRPRTASSCAVCEREDRLSCPTISLLPSCDLIPLLLQTSIHEIRIGLIRLGGTDDSV